MKPLGRARQPSCDCRLLQEHHYKAIGHQRLGSADTQLAFKNDIPGPVRGPTATYLKHLLGKHLCNPRVVLHFASLSCKVGENDEQHCREAHPARCEPETAATHTATCQISREGHGAHRQVDAAGEEVVQDQPSPCCGKEKAQGDQHPHTKGDPERIRAQDPAHKMRQHPLKGRPCFPQGQMIKVETLVADCSSSCRNGPRT